MPNVWREEIARFGTATFGNPWHDEIGRFAPKGQGRTSGFDKESLTRMFDEVVDSSLGSDGFDPAALDAWIGEVPVVAEIPTESKLKVEKSVRELQKSLAGVEPTPTLKEQVKDWFKRMLDTGPVEPRPVFPWLSLDTPHPRPPQRR